MSVTKIRKLSSWTLLIASIISIVVLALFFFGGIVPGTEGTDLKEPIYTGLLLNWMYVLFVITIVVAIVFAVGQFVSLLRISPKSALSSLIVLVLFVVMLFITYAMGDGTPLTGLNSDSEKYNIPFWLKTTDMWLYSSYVLLVLVIIAAIAGSIKKTLSK